MFFDKAHVTRDEVSVPKTPVCGLMIMHMEQLQVTVNIAFL
jgi:hypothetical protein